MPATSDRPLRRDYARIERERRFLLSSLPEAAVASSFHRLRDRYIAGTHIRLRLVEDPGGDLVIAKLGQKVADPDDPDNRRHQQMTTLYLAPGEADVFAALPAVTSVKRRYTLLEQGWTFVIDVYEAPAQAAGVIVAEVECDTDEELAAIIAPAWADREVTDDPRFGGAALAARGAL